jgi:hypothetical protein
MIIKAEIQAGTCGFQVAVRAECVDGQNVTLDIRTDCENIARLAQRLKENGPVDAFTEIDRRRPGALEEAAADCLAAVCVGCVAPAGISKCIQMAAGLLLPADVAMRFREEESE